MKHERDKREPRQHPRDARRDYRQARQLKRGAALYASAIPHCIIARGIR